MRNRSLLLPYPLSRSSRNRRRMMIIGGEQPAEQSDIPLEIPTDSPPPTSETKQSVDQVRSPANKPQKRDIASSTSCSSAFRGIRQLLQRGDSLCWVFAGDQMSGGANGLENGRPFSHLFAEFLHLGLHRLQDDVINVASESESAEHLLENIEENILRFLPDVVSMTLALSDCKNGRSERKAFRNRLCNIIEVIRQADAIPLLQTPFRVDPLLNLQITRLPAYVKIMREVAWEEEVPCIDHWEHWKPLCDHPGKLATLLSDDGLFLNHKGNMAVVRLMIKRLRIECDLPEWCDDFSLSSQNNLSSQTMAVVPSTGK